MSDTDDTRPIERDTFLVKSQFKVVVPSGLDKQTSSTSYCEDCFAGQVFSKSLQRFLIDYSLKVTGKNPLTDKL